MGEEIAFKNGRISKARDLDLDLRSGHTAYSHASLIGDEFRLVAWLSGRTSVFGRRTFSIQRSTSS